MSPDRLATEPTTTDRVERATVLASARLRLQAELADLTATLAEPPDDQVDGVARATLARVEAALARLDEGRYGVCTGCEAVIPHERLAILPDTATCIACQSHAEGG